MVLKRWILNQSSPEKIKEISARYNISPFLAEIIAGRNMGSDDIDEFFIETELESPFVLKDMDKAVQRIEYAVENSEKIVIYGDYDCDGITSAALLYMYLSSCGADVLYYIPDRLGEGYGLNKDAILFLKKQGTDLIITVDNGISAIEEASFAKEIGIDLIITDHHSVGNYLPDAVAVINPHRCDCPSKYKDLAGVGVTFKLITALDGGNYSVTLENFSDIAALGTIGDIVPLTSENRTLVKYGLKMFPNSENLGISSLLEASSLADKKISSAAVSFGIVPRINAAGRVDTADQAVELLICEDEETAHSIAENLTNLNKLRQNAEAEIIEEIDKMFEENPGRFCERVIVVCGENWNQGVIGIVSARITEKFGKPSFILSKNGNTATGSGRSINGFSLYSALCECRELLNKFGGHKLAAGASLPVENVELFAKALNEYAALNFPSMPVPEYVIDKVLELKEINIKNVKELSLLEPFGQNNPQAVFLLKDAKIAAVNSIGGDRHTRIRIEMGGGIIPVVFFGMESSRFPYKIGNMVDILANLDINTYNGETNVSVKLKDIRPSGFNQEKYLESLNTYESFIRGEDIPDCMIESITPEYSEFGLVYKYLRTIRGYDNDIDFLYFELGCKINYCKLRIILDVMDELKLINLSRYKINMIENPGKVDLASSCILSKLRG